MKTTKKILSILITTLLLFSLFGCGTEPKEHSTDFSDIENRLISLRDVAELLQTADEKTTSGEVQYVNMGELFQIVADDSDRADRLSEEYEQYEIKQQKRIEELEEKINEIYSHWDQY